MSEPINTFLIAYSDSGFTNPHEVLLPDEPKDCTGKFTHIGAQYWGYETGRHKATKIDVEKQSFSYDHEAHNWILIGLKKRSEINKITVSTKWFTGNQVREVSVLLADELSGRKTKVLNRVPLNPDSDHEYEFETTTATECLIECYYEGGISRINLFGEETSEQLQSYKSLLETAKITHVSNEHYGNPAMAVKGNREEMHMVGWESARTGFGERALFQLDTPAYIYEVVVDTYLHRLNSPLSCHLFTLNEKDEGKVEEHMNKAPQWKLVFPDQSEIIPDDFQSYMIDQQYLKDKGPNETQFEIKLHLLNDSPWNEVLPFAPLFPDRYHRFKNLDYHGISTHLLYMHYPNGGIHSLKAFGLEQT